MDKLGLKSVLEEKGVQVEYLRGIRFLEPHLRVSWNDKTLDILVGGSKGPVEE